MSDARVQRLHAFARRREFFIGIDSDGCAFDTMEIKHKECFIPNIIKHFVLQAVSKFAREAGEFVNLYSKWRGINRFPGLVLTLDLLRDHPEVRERGFTAPDLPATRAWLEAEPRPGNPGLEHAIAQSNGDVRAELERVLAWSHAVNTTVAEMVHGVAPFPHVGECLKAAESRADLMVVSATPAEALEREWAEHDLAGFTRLICGQEMGTKREHLQVVMTRGYPPDHVLMIGDAPGDRQAAEANGALFFPINPGAEAESWRRLLDEGLARFFDGGFAGAYAAELAAEFEALLPETPPWQARLER